MTILANFDRAPKSILEGVTPPVSTTAPASPATSGGTVLDDLKKIEEERQRRAPAAPAAQKFRARNKQEPGDFSPEIGSSL